MGPLVPLFCTSDDVYPGFQSQGGFSCWHDLSPTCNRFTSGVTHANLLAAGMAVEPFISTYLCNQCKLCACENVLFNYIVALVP